MRFRKVYGQSKEENCVFCDKPGLFKNKQGFSVCLEHKSNVMEERNCVCGELMQVKESKWGAFFLCPSCGPISLKKVNEVAEGPFKLNKRFRKDKPELKPEKPVTMNYPVPIHNDRSPVIKASSDTKKNSTITQRDTPGSEETKESSGSDTKKEKVYTLDELKMLWD